LSSIALRDTYLAPDDLPVQPDVDYELGGIRLQDPSEGLMYQTWTFRLDEANVTVEAPNSPPRTLFSRLGITEISGTFDQNMNPCVAFMADDEAFLYWFDTVPSQQVITNITQEFNAGDYTRSPKVCLDDKRPLQTGASDIILAYIRGVDETLAFRAQRDRFTVEYPLRTGVAEDLLKVGMHRSHRLQFQIRSREYV